MKFQDARKAGYQACLDGCYRNPPPLADEAIAEWLAGWDEAQPERDAWEADNNERASMFY